MFAPGQWKEEISIQGKKQRNIHNTFCASSAVEKVETKKKEIREELCCEIRRDSTFLLTATRDHVWRGHLADVQGRYWCFDKTKQVGLLFSSDFANSTWNRHKGKENWKKLSEEAGRRNSICISRQTIQRNKMAFQYSKWKMSSGYSSLNLSRTSVPWGGMPMTYSLKMGAWN